MESALRQQRASLDRQRQAIHAQLGEKTEATSLPLSPEPFITPLVATNQVDCPPISSDQLNDLVSNAARKQALDPALLKAVIKQESGFKPCAVSAKGAQGLMQLMPSTARELRVANAFDPAQNIQAGAAYLKQLLTRYNGDLTLALVGYNAGPGRADQGLNAVYPLETQNYVASILADLGIGQEESVEDREDLAPAGNEPSENLPAKKDSMPQPAKTVDPIKAPSMVPKVNFVAIKSAQ